MLLHDMQAVQDEGGYESITRDKKWPKIAVRLCYQASKNIGSTLRVHYEKTLYPFDVFMAGATADDKVALRLQYTLQLNCIYDFLAICFVHYFVIYLST